jgi:NAD(P)-dependent dehydrogenase (short-subunit alcohol dehydrogenase family)
MEDSMTKKKSFLDKMWFAYPLMLAPAAAAQNFIAFIRRFDYRNKVVLITGGSRGLGLELARQLSREKAKIVLASRDQKELLDAKEILKIADDHLMLEVCDVTDNEQVEKLISGVQSTFGTIDVLINCAGEISVAPLNTVDVQDFENAMKVHFWGPLYTMFAVIPGMRRRGGGRIVNISSIGGKVSVPLLLPYCASKHALTGLSEGMRIELLKQNILVTTVCPGMMRTGSHVNAKFKGEEFKEFAMFSILNAFPFASTDAKDAAQQIIEACRKGEPELIITLPAQIAATLQGLFPAAVSEVLAFTNWFLPSNGRKDAVSGWQSESSVAPSVLTVLSDKEIDHNNERSNN